MDLDINTPSEIQALSIPVILKGENDVVALAKTGSGKTLAFGLPILQSVNFEADSIQSLILAPTRELCQQITKDLESYASHNSKLKINAIYGGTTLKSQIEELKKQPQIVVATPGRLLDLLEKQKINLGNIVHLVLDEADEMLNAFQSEIIAIVKQTNTSKQVSLFTATWSSNVKQLVNDFLSKNVITIETSSDDKLPDTINHQFM